MKLLPCVDTSTDMFKLDTSRDITVAVLIYISLIAYSLMLALEIHNVYFYLLKQGKYKVFPLTLFYALVIPCTLIRIYYNFNLACSAAYILLYELFPSLFKICIGFTQILIMTELTVRVDQSMFAMEDASSSGLSMNQSTAQAKIERYESIIKISRIIVTGSCIIFLTYSTL